MSHRVITLRIESEMHAALKAAAHKKSTAKVRVSMNEYLIDLMLNDPTFCEIYRELWNANEEKESA